jgi:hypothetical protein
VWVSIKMESGLFGSGSSLGSPGAEMGTLAIAVYINEKQHNETAALNQT